MQLVQQVLKETKDHLGLQARLDQLDLKVQRVRKESRVQPVPQARKVNRDPLESLVSQGLRARKEVRESPEPRVLLVRKV